MDADKEMCSRVVSGYDFDLIRRCLGSGHHTFIGAWSRAWLGLSDDHVVLDEAPPLGTGERKRADLMLATRKGELIGAIEVENKARDYVTDIDRLVSYRKAHGIRFGILQTCTDGASTRRRLYEARERAKACRDALLISVLNLEWGPSALVEPFARAGYHNANLRHEVFFNRE